MSVSNRDTPLTEAQGNLFVEYLPMAEKIARFRGGKLKLEFDRELLRDAAVDGLINATRDYDEAKGAFIKYANYRINGAVLDAMRYRDTLPRGLRRILRNITQDDKPVDEVIDVIQNLEVNEKSKRLLSDHVYRKAKGQSLFTEMDAPKHGKDGGAVFMDPPSREGTPEQHILQGERTALLSEAIEALPFSTRDKMIVRAYFYDGDRKYASAEEQNFTMKMIANEFGMVESRVSQIVTRAKTLLSESPDLQAVAGVRAAPSATQRILEERAKDGASADGPAAAL